MLDDAFVLRCMRYRACSQRYVINIKCPKPEEAEGFVRSSDSPEPEWSEELKAQHRRLWPLLSSQEQQRLANWRAKHFESSGNGASDSPAVLQQLWKLLRVVEAEGTLSPTAKRQKQNTWQTAISRALTRLFAPSMAR
jgi:hypothetical protein